MKSTPEAKKSDVVDVEALPKDVEASIVNIVSPSIIKKDEPIAKQMRPSPLTQPQSVPASNVSIFGLLQN
jgi:flagellar assembly factor FliW